LLQRNENSIHIISSDLENPDYSQIYNQSMLAKTALIDFSLGYPIALPLEKQIQSTDLW
jgi:hypothetical protein